MTYNLPFSQLSHHLSAAPRIEEEHSGDRFGRRDDFLSSRRMQSYTITPCNRCVTSSLLADRQAAPVRDDIPLPNQPPYTAFIGNLAFDLTESELENFFSGTKVCYFCLFLYIFLKSTDKNCQNHQRQGRKAQRFWLHRI